MSDKINKKSTQSHTRVLALYPTSRGFGYVVFEGATNPLDWGNMSIKNSDNKLALKKVKSFIFYYQPDVLVSENPIEKGSRRSQRINSLLLSIKRLEKVNIIVKTYSRYEIINVFEQFGAKTKYEISRAIIRFLPVFEYHKPPKRKPWMSEDSRMAIFDAVALAMTYFYLEE